MKKRATEDKCSVKGCGRQRYARNLCQTHHRQILTTGKIRPIRPYQKRRTNTEKFGGLRLTTVAAAAVEKYAREKQMSNGAAIGRILEDWSATHGGRARRRSA